jgi:hypothetical protein
MMVVNILPFVGHFTSVAVKQLLNYPAAKLKQWNERVVLYPNKTLFLNVEI